MDNYILPKQNVAILDDKGNQNIDDSDIDSDSDAYVKFDNHIETIFNVDSD